ncbi:MAG TPA: DUF3048 C-terminal domain-containing protein, partial [Patescibacteria group bacterium]|nr:DUF3048 C-terminal domain-containing protein [Patescibacteria group bacterium]
VTVEFWSGQPDYTVVWTYSKTSNTYLRATGGQTHIDNNTKKQLQPKNVVVLYEKESNANDGYENNLHELFGDKGTGNAVVFQNGQEIQATWRKADRTARTELTDKKTGKEIKFVRGQIWFQIVPTYNPVSVQ